MKVNTRREPNCFRLTRLALALAVLVAGPAARANVFQWTNTLGGSWFGATNWSPNGVPAGTDVAYITNAGTYTVTLVSSASLTRLGNLGFYNQPGGVVQVDSGTLTYADLQSTNFPTRFYRFCLP